MNIAVANDKTTLTDFSNGEILHFLELAPYLVTNIFVL